MSQEINFLADEYYGARSEQKTAVKASNNTTDGKIAFVAQALEATLYSHPTSAAYVEHSQK